ncbi:MAG: hypothetical protein KKD44_27085 [Proteobacteria bacterium]|nr:hypothetical protein [Pseudomonadota bacterium]
MRIGVSWLEDWEYCPYKMYLEHILGIDVPPSDELYAGIEAHDKLDAMAVVTEMSLTEMVVRAVKLGEELCVRNSLVFNDRLIGRIDELYLS